MLLKPLNDASLHHRFMKLFDEGSEAAWCRVRLLQHSVERTPASIRMPLMNDLLLAMSRQRQMCGDRSNRWFVRDAHRWLLTDSPSNALWLDDLATRATKIPSWHLLTCRRTLVQYSEMGY